MRYQLKIEVLPILQKDQVKDISGPLSKEEWLTIGIDPTRLPKFFDDVIMSEDIIVDVNYSDNLSSPNKKYFVVGLQGEDLPKSLVDLEHKITEFIKEGFNKYFDDNKKNVFKSPGIPIREVDITESPAQQEVSPEDPVKARKDLVNSILSHTPDSNRYCNAVSNGGCNCLGCVNMYIPFVNAGITYAEWDEWRQENEWSQENILTSINPKFVASFDIPLSKEDEKNVQN